MFPIQNIFSVSYFVFCELSMVLSEPVYFILFHVHIQIKFRGRVSNRDILGTFLHISFFVKIKYIGYIVVVSVYICTIYQGWAMVVPIHQSYINNKNRI